MARRRVDESVVKQFKFSTTYGTWLFRQIGDKIYIYEKELFTQRYHLLACEDRWEYGGIPHFIHPNLVKADRVLYGDKRKGKGTQDGDE